MALGNRQLFSRGSKILGRRDPGTLMQGSGFISRWLHVSILLIAGFFLIIAFPFSPAAQKTALHLDGTPADPFQEASGKPIVLVFVRNGLTRSLLERVCRSTVKMQCRLYGTPADPFQEASGKPIVLVFVRADCPVSNRY